MAKQYHAWDDDWNLFHNFRVYLEHLSHIQWQLQSGFDETERMAFERYATAEVSDDDEAFDIGCTDINRLQKISALIDEMETAIEKMRKLYALINALGSPACEADEDDDDENDFTDA